MPRKRHHYVAPVKYTPEQLERFRLADLLNDARSTYRHTRKGGYWEGDAGQIAYADQCHAEYRRGRDLMRMYKGCRCGAGVPCHCPTVEAI